MIIVIGTGRCGSTLLSDMIAKCRRVLVLSEFFMSLAPGGFPDGLISGDRFWRILSTPRIKYSTLLKHNVHIPEYIYSNLRSKSFEIDAIPPIMLVTLPFLSETPHLLYDSLAAVVQEFPAASITTQYSRLFDILKASLDRDIVFERSGNSIRFARQFELHFPNARYIYLRRRREDCIESMAAHPTFRLAVAVRKIKEAVGFDPFELPNQDVKGLPEPLCKFLPGSFCARTLREAPFSLVDFAEMHDDLADEGEAFIRGRDDHQRIVIAYEDLVSSPEPTLASIAQFCDLPEDGNWLRQAAALVR